MLGKILASDSFGEPALARARASGRSPRSPRRSPARCFGPAPTPARSPSGTPTSPASGGARRRAPLFDLPRAAVTAIPPVASGVAWPRSRTATLAETRAAAPARGRRRLSGGSSARRASARGAGADAAGASRRDGGDSVGAAANRTPSASSGGTARQARARGTLWRALSGAVAAGLGFHGRRRPRGVGRGRGDVRGGGAAPRPRPVRRRRRARQRRAVVTCHASGAVQLWRATRGVSGRTRKANIFSATSVRVPGARAEMLAGPNSADGPVVGAAALDRLLCVGYRNGWMKVFVLPDRAEPTFGRHSELSTSRAEGTAGDTGFVSFSPLSPRVMRSRAPPGRIRAHRADDPASRG